MENKTQARLSDEKYAKAWIKHSATEIDAGIPKIDRSVGELILNIAPARALSILDIGCGHAQLPHSLLKMEIALKKYIGLERNLLLVSNAKKIPNLAVDAHEWDANSADDRVKLKTLSKDITFVTALRILNNIPDDTCYELLLSIWRYFKEQPFIFIVPFQIEEFTNKEIELSGLTSTERYEVFFGATARHYERSNKQYFDSLNEIGFAHINQKNLYLKKRDTPSHVAFYGTI